MLLGSAGSCSGVRQQALPAPATPKVVGGRTQSTLKPPKATYKTEAERLALVRKARQSRQALVAKLPPPAVKCPRIRPGSHLEIDGKLDERAWQRAPLITGFRLTRKLTAATSATRARLLWDKRHLYVAFECDDADVIATLTERDADFWKEDVAEVFIDADGDEMSYIEIELSPRGLLYDASIADYRPEIDWPADIGHLDVYYSLKIFDAPAIRSAVRVDGTLNDSTDADRGWSCELAIPWKDLARGTNVNRAPPKPGDVWRMGLYRININTDKQANPDEYAAWNPTTSWFHVPWSFGRVEFVK